MLHAGPSGPAFFLPARSRDPGARVGGSEKITSSKPRPRRSDHALDRAVWVVVEIVDADRAAVAATVGLDGAVVVDEIVATLEGDDRVVIGVTVARDSVDDAGLEFPRAGRLVGHRVNRLLREIGGVGEVVDAVALVEPGRFGEARDLGHGVDRAVEFGHVGLSVSMR